MFKILPLDKPKGLVLQLYSPDTDPKSVHIHIMLNLVLRTGLKLCDNKRHHMGQQSVFLINGGFVNNHYSKCLVTNARNYTFHLACKLTENIIHQHYKCLLLKEQESILFVIVETHLLSKDPKYIRLPGHVYQQLSMFITKSLFVC